MTFARRRWKSIHTLLAVVGLSAGLAILPIGPKSFMKSTLIEAQAPLWTALRDLSDWQDAAALKLRSKDDLVSIIQELASTQAGLELKMKTLEAVEAKNARLEGLLNMPASAGYETRVVRVLRRDVNSWWQLLWIDAGSAQGICAGMGVISREGVLGRVREVFEQSAVVELVTSPYFRMAVQFPDDARPFIFQGGSLAFAQAPTGNVSALQPEMALKADATRPLVTTGLSGSFPAGLPVGTLFETSTLSEGGLIEGRARLAAPINSLREVCVLVPYR